MTTAGSNLVDRLENIGAPSGHTPATPRLGRIHRQRDYSFCLTTTSRDSGTEIAWIVRRHSCNGLPPKATQKSLGKVPHLNGEPTFILHLRLMGYRLPWNACYRISQENPCNRSLQYPRHPFRQTRASRGNSSTPDGSRYASFWRRLHPSARPGCLGASQGSVSGIAAPHFPPFSGRRCSGLRQRFSKQNHLGLLCGFREYRRSWGSAS